MLHDDVLPLLSMTKKEEVTYKKKVVENDKVSVVEDKKIVYFNINKLHPVIVKNVLSRAVV
jgi:hypothetical protein